MPKPQIFQIRPCHPDKQDGHHCGDDAEHHPGATAQEISECSEVQLCHISFPFYQKANGRIFCFYYSILGPDIKSHNAYCDVFVEFFLEFVIFLLGAGEHNFISGCQKRSLFIQAADAYRGFRIGDNGFLVFFGFHFVFQFVSLCFLFQITSEIRSRGFRVCDISCGFTRYRFLLRRVGLLVPQRQQRSHSPQTLGSDRPGRTNISVTMKQLA